MNNTEPYLRPNLFTFMYEHSPQEGHMTIVTLSQYRPKIEIMVDIGLFRKATFEEC